MARTIYLFIVAFLSGGIIMGLEMAGMRVLAPDIGNQIQSWACQISVFLLALTLGYFIGGLVADKSPRTLTLSYFLFAAAISVLAINLIYDPIREWINSANVGGWYEDPETYEIIYPYGLLSQLIDPILFSAGSFLIPCTILGMTSPYVIRLLARDVEHIGSLAGALYAFSTLGSIIGTLLTAFLLINLMPIRGSLLPMWLTGPPPEEFYGTPGIGLIPTFGYTLIVLSISTFVLGLREIKAQPAAHGD